MKWDGFGSSSSSCNASFRSLLPTFLGGCRWLAVAGIVLAISDSQNQAANQPADPMEQTKRIEAELANLDKSPVGRKIAEIEKKFSTESAQVHTALEENRAEFHKLQDTDAYRDYERKRRALEDQRVTEWSIERKAMADAAKNLYAARHNELRKLALSDAPQARRLGFNVLTYPRVDGSTSTHPLSVIIASRILDTPYEWIYPDPTGSPWRVRPELPMDLYLFDEYEYYPSADQMEFSLAASRVVAKPSRAGQERLAIMINSLLAISTSTHNAYTNLIERKCDLNFTARAPSEDELALAKKKRVEIALKPIARDALVFIVNYRNPVKTISRPQILQIYQEKLHNWAALGGGTNEIVALWRDRNSGSRELFDLMVSAGQPVPEPTSRRDLFSNSMAGPYNQITQNEQALGYSVYYYEHYMALSPYTRTVAVDGVEPTAATIASGQYPYTAEVYAAYRADEPAGSPTMKLLEWLVSPEGQAVIRESGYVPVK
jgi:ABC-type phosphate transport system substrate-binding protein